MKDLSKIYVSDAPLSDFDGRWSILDDVGSVEYIPTDLANQQAQEAERRGYERGVREAAKHIDEMRCSTRGGAIQAILSLLLNYEGNNK